MDSVCVHNTQMNMGWVFYDTHCMVDERSICMLVCVCVSPLAFLSSIHGTLALASFHYSRDVNVAGNHSPYSALYLHMKRQIYFQSEQD